MSPNCEVGESKTPQTAGGVGDPKSFTDQTILVSPSLKGKRLPPSRNDTRPIGKGHIQSTRTFLLQMDLPPSVRRVLQYPQPCTSTKYGLALKLSFQKLNRDDR